MEKNNNKINLESIFLNGSNDSWITTKSDNYNLNEKITDLEAEIYNLKQEIKNLKENLYLTFFGEEFKEKVLKKIEE